MKYSRVRSKISIRHVIPSEIFRLCDPFVSTKQNFQTDILTQIRQYFQNNESFFEKNAKKLLTSSEKCAKIVNCIIIAQSALLLIIRNKTQKTELR